MGMDMEINFENSMGIMSIGMEMTFKNEYECGYSYTCSEPAPRPSLWDPTRGETHSPQHCPND